MRKPEKMKARITALVLALALVVGVMPAMTFTVSADDGLVAANLANLNYAKLLQYSLYFFDANMCGNDVSTRSAFSWRSNCHSQDSAISVPPAFGGGTIDLSGGFHDAGDHVKFGLPTTYASVTLGWAYYEYKDTFVRLGLDDHARRILDHFAEYHRKSIIWNGSSVHAYAYQVGDGGDDHGYWGPPESQSSSSQGGNRRAYFTDGTSSNPGTDQLALAAASLAANYVNFGNEEDLKAAIALYELADNSSKGVAQSGTTTYYNSSNWEDDFALAGEWLRIATGNNSYRRIIFGYPHHTAEPMTWDGVWPQVICLRGDDWSTVRSQHLQRINTSSTSYLRPYAWGGARHNAAFQGLALIYANKTSGNDDYATWADGQMRFLLGDNNQNNSYVMGYDSIGTGTPAVEGLDFRVHHRAATGFTGWTNYNNNTQPTNLLVGALIGGPEPSGSFTNNYSYYESTEVACDYNANLVLAAAGHASRNTSHQPVAVSSIPGLRAIAHTITWNANGGTFATQPPTTVAPGGTVAAPAAPTKTGAIFGGWYADENLTTPWNFATDTVTEDITLYAKWALASVILGGDEASGDLLEVTITANGGVVPCAWGLNSGSSDTYGWQRVYFTTAVNSLWLHDDTLRIFAIGNTQQTITLGDKVVETDGAESITRTWLSTSPWTNGVELVETFRLEKGADFYTRTIEIKNNSGSALENVRLYIGGDTYTYNSYGSINTDYGAAFVYRYAGEIIMSLRGITAPTNYFAARNMDGQTPATQANNLSNATATGALVDTGYYLQWGGANAISIPVGASYTFETSEQFTTEQELTWSAGAGTGNLQSVDIDNANNKISAYYAHEGVTVAELIAGFAYTLPFNPAFVVIDDNNAVMVGNALLENADGGTVQIREDAFLALGTYDLEVEAIPQSSFSLDWEGTPGSFADLTYGYAAGNSVTYTVKNTGNQPLTGISAAISAGSDAFEIAAPPSNTLGVGATTTITVRGRTGLNADTTPYSGILTVTWANDGGAGITQNLSQMVKANFEAVPPTATVTGVTVNPPATEVQKGETFQFGAAVTGTNNPAQTVTWSVSGGNGITGIDTNGLLTVAADEAAATLTVTATSTHTTSVSGTALVTINQPILPVAPSITTTSLPDGTVNTAYSQTLAATGDAPMTWTLESGSLPDGLNFAANGTISGVPTINGTFRFAASATNSAGSDTQSLEITIIAALAKSITIGEQTGVLTQGTAGSATFVVAKANINSGFAITLNNINGVIGIALGTSSTTGDSTTVSIGITAATPAGTHPLTLTIDGVTSASFNLTVVDAPIAANYTVTPYIPPSGNDNQNQTNQGNQGSITATTPTAQSPAATDATMPDSGGDEKIEEKIEIKLLLPGAEITLSLDASGSVATAEAGSFTVEAAVIPMRDLSGMQAAQAKGYETVVSIDVFVGDEKVDVPLTVSLPYNLKPNENPAAVRVWHMDDNGNLTDLNGTFDKTTGMITFAINHQSFFVVGYDPVALWVNAFSDISADAWYYGAVAFANYHGLMGGYGNNIFAPSDSMTRAMFVTVLWNLEGKPAPNGTASFSDVSANAWEHDAVMWAAENGIVNGIGGGRFAPDRAISRQEMAVMLYNYAGFKGYEIPQNRNMPDFADIDQVEPWAETAARKLAEAGILSGSNNEFKPEADATRAEVAQMFRNFVRFITGR